MQLLWKSGMFLLLMVLLLFANCKKELSCEGCRVENKPPVAIAGSDIVIVLPLDSVLLDGTASSDPDGKISKWQWTKIEGPASFTIVDNAVSKTTAKNLTAGIYQLELSVTDDGGLVAKDTVQILIDNPAINQSPIAHAGADQTLSLPKNTVTLDGSASTDPDNNITSYLWTKIAGPVSLNIVSITSVQTQVNALVEGVYEFELKVTDAGGLFATDTVQVMVNSPLANQLPIANAGVDQSIVLPANEVLLDGSSSTDPDNNITAFLWTKIDGPSSFTIANPNFTETKINSLVKGVYEFELKVTDAGGLFAKDTVQVRVEPTVVSTPCDNSIRQQVNARLVPVGNLSQVRGGMTVAYAGNKLLFAGGTYSLNGTYVSSSRVDIYDIATQNWSTAELSAPRAGITAVANGNKVFFGGGVTDNVAYPVNNVDIYDVSTNTWKVTRLGAAGHNMAAAAVGNKVLFAGGDSEFAGSPGISREKRVDIYNISSNTWSGASLSDGKQGGHVAVTVDNKVYFAGGLTNSTSVPSYSNASNKIDIYDNATNSWSISSLLQGKTDLAGIAVDNKIYWAGGSTGKVPTVTTCSVEIKDVNAGGTSVQYLSKTSSLSYAVVKDKKILFFGNSRASNSFNKFDIYDIATNTWSIGVMNLSISGAFIISVYNTVYVAGALINGLYTNQVYKLDF